MSKFLDHIEPLSVAKPHVVMRDGRSPLEMEMTWDVEDQRSFRVGTRYRLGVQFGAQIVVPGGTEVGLVRRRLRELLAREVYGELDEVRHELIELQLKLYNVPDKVAQDMATDLNFLLIKLDKATT